MLSHQVQKKEEETARSTRGKKRDHNLAGDAARYSRSAFFLHSKAISFNPCHLNTMTLSQPTTTDRAESPAGNSADPYLHLHYNQPSSEWSEALPVGNGRLGAMVHGRTTTELLQLNEDSVWYGGPQDRTPSDALQRLPVLRQLIRAGRHPEAEELVRTAFFSTPASMRHYEPLGTCSIEFNHDNVVGYKRWLDLSTSVCETVYSCSGSSGEPVKVRRSVIASFPDQVLAMRITASQKLRFVVRLNRTSEIEWETNEFVDSIQASGNKIVLQATPGGSHSNRLGLVLGVHCNDIGTERGSVEAIGNCLVVHSSDCTLVMGAQTLYRAEEPEKAADKDVDAALKLSWEDLLERHMTDYRSLFGRLSLRMWPDACHIPTNERLKDNRDPGLAALYHNFGRYLLISCSRDSDKPLPANLQGIWNPSFAPPWGSKYTININIQMNYWPISMSSLFECALPLVDLLERMAVRGRKTARTMYDCQGWCAHHNTDIWADTDPQDRWMPATLWPLGGAWLCIDMVKLVRQRYDGALHARLAPVLEGCVEFLLDFLIPSECGHYLVTSPSVSPENTFLSNGEPGILCEGSTIDMSIVQTVFADFLWTVQVLHGGRHPLFGKVEAAMRKLPPVLINAQGLIQEWGLNDYGESEPGHRHVSHLFGLFPGNTIGSEDEIEAAKKVLASRAAHGGGHTGWSRAWLLNLHARLYDAEGCGEHVELLLRDSTLPNMLDNHPPFQIDGNFGGCAGILECLVRCGQVDSGADIILLPACPRGWLHGELAGIHIGHGVTVSFAWRHNEVLDPVVVKSDSEDEVAIQYPGGSIAVVRGRGEHCVTHADAVARPRDAQTVELAAP